MSLFQLNAVAAYSRSKFDPASLFASGEVGAWYDPSDLSMLYQDLGGTPVTSDGQTVGLMLDKHKSLALGSEEITNGTFDSDLTSWTFNQQTSGATVTVDQGRALIEISNADASSFCNLYQSFPTVIGKTYKVSGTIEELGASANFYGVRKTDTSSITSIVNNVDYANTLTPSGYFVATATTTYIHLQVNEPSSSGTSSYAFDNISVKEVSGNHASQETPTKRPTYRTDGTLHWLEFDGADNNLEITTDVKATPSDWSFICGARVDTDTALQHLMDTNTGRLVFAARSDTSGNSGYFDGAWQGASVSSGVNHVFAYDMSTQGVLRVDRSQILSASYTQKAVSGDTAIGSSNSTTGSFLDGRVYELILVDRSLTTNERDSAESYIAGKSGVTL